MLRLSPRLTLRFRLRLRLILTLNLTLNLTRNLTPTLTPISYWLHAHRAELRHPSSGERVCFVAPPPPELALEGEEPSTRSTQTQ